jgi:4,5-DOPA dioxygenase extradiol
VSSKVPPIFVAHGTPAVANDERRARELQQWSRELPRPRGILVISSGWQEEQPTRGSTGRPQLLEGESVRIAYPAPAAPDLAYELHGLLPIERAPERGWDFGVYGPLRHLFPEADIPILQLSLVTAAVPRRLFGLGRKIGVLAARGVLIVGSGGITWNESEMARDVDAPPADWSREFDAWVANQLADAELDELLQWRAKGPHARRAQPSTQHIDPLFVVAGAASLYDHAVGFPIRGFDHGTMSRRCIQFGR